MSKNHFHGPNKLLLIIKHKWDFPCVCPTNEITIFVCQMESDVKFSQHFYMARNRLSVRLMMVKPLECVVLIEFLGKFNHFSMRTQVFFFSLFTLSFVKQIHSLCIENMKKLCAFFVVDSSIFDYIYMIYWLHFFGMNAESNLFSAHTAHWYCCCQFQLWGELMWFVIKLF